MTNQKGQFVKGTIPWNKGKKCPHTADWFRKMKGRRPWNKNLKGACSEETILKMRMAKLGKPGNRRGIKNSEETRKKLSLALKGRVSPNKGKPVPWLSGENHWCWKGGITPLNLVVRNSKKYAEWRTKCFQRDNYVCQGCNDQTKRKLEVNHKKTFSKIMLENNIKTLEEAINCEELWNISNGETLCRDCHDLIPSTYRRKRNNLGRYIGIDT